jgi:hypothetical protein
MNHFRDLVTYICYLEREREKLFVEQIISWFMKHTQLILKC